MLLEPVRPTVKTPAENFTGDVYLTMAHQPDPASGTGVGLVRFTPGAHTNWHRHTVGQTLHVTEGVGLVVSRDGTVIRLRAGDTVWTPAGEEHWHGAGPDTFLCHLAITEGTPDGSPGTTWLEPVSEAEYAAANA